MAISQLATSQIGEDERLERFLFDEILEIEVAGEEGLKEQLSKCDRRPRTDENTLLAVVTSSMEYNDTYRYSHACIESNSICLSFQIYVDLPHNQLGSALIFNLHNLLELRNL
jgi:hypothetical protein